MNTHTDKAQLYTIREVAKFSGLPESTLRYYETIGLIHPITRDSSSKHRVYNEQDVDFAMAIACLNATGMSLEDMRTYLSPVRRYIPELLDDVLEGRINPGLVFDFTTDLNGFQEAYDAMDERRAIKSLLQIGTI